MGRLPDTTPAAADSGRVLWMRRKMVDLGKDIGAARKDKSWSAVASLHREQRSIRDQLDAAKLEEAAAKARALAEEAGREPTAEERAEQVAEAARVATVEELEVFVTEWTRRANYRLRVDDDGVLHLERVEALRLVR